MRDRDMFATDALRTEGTAHLVAAARLTGARRFVVESMVFGYGYGDHGDRPVSEEDPFAPRGRTPQLERHIAAMLGWTPLYPSSREGLAAMRSAGP